jgi:hypothetical protein
MPLNDNILDAIKNRKYCLRHVELDKQAGGGRMRDNICTYHSHCCDHELSSLADLIQPAATVFKAMVGIDTYK